MHILKNQSISQVQDMFHIQVLWTDAFTGAFYIRLRNAWQCITTSWSGVGSRMLWKFKLTSQKKRYYFFPFFSLRKQLSGDFSGFCIESHQKWLLLHNVLKIPIRYTFFRISRLSPIRNQLIFFFTPKFVHIYNVFLVKKTE